MENKINFGNCYYTCRKNYTNKATTTRSNTLQNYINTPIIVPKSNTTSASRTIDNSSRFNKDIHNIVPDMNLIRFRRKRAPHMFSTQYLFKNINIHTKTDSNDSSYIFKNKYNSNNNIFNRNNQNNSNQNTFLQSINKNKSRNKFTQYSNNQKQLTSIPLDKTSSTFKNNNIILTLGDVDYTKKNRGDGFIDNLMSRYEYNLQKLKNKHTNIRKKILNKSNNNKNIIFDFSKENNCYSKNTLQEYCKYLSKFLNKSFVSNKPNEKNNGINDRCKKLYLKNIINKITRDLLFLNEKNEEITKGKIINLLEKENVNLNNNIDKYLNSLCQIKNFSFLSKGKNNNDLLSTIYPLLNKIIAFNLDNSNTINNKNSLNNKTYEDILKEKELLELNNIKLEKLKSKELKSFDLLSNLNKLRKKKHLHNFNYEIPNNTINNTMLITKMDKKIGVSLYKQKSRSHFNLVNILKLEKNILSESRRSKSFDSRYDNLYLNVNSHLGNYINGNISTSERSFEDYSKISNKGDLKSKAFYDNTTIKKLNKSNENRFFKRNEKESIERKEKIEIKNVNIKKPSAIEQFNEIFNFNDTLGSRNKINLDIKTIEKFKKDNKKNHKKIFLSKTIIKNDSNIKKHNEFIGNQKLIYKYNINKKEIFNFNKGINDEKNKTYIKKNTINRGLEKSINDRNYNNKSPIKITNIKKPINSKETNNDSKSLENSNEENQENEQNNLKEDDKDKNNTSKINKKNKAKPKKKAPSFLTKEKKIFLGRRLLGIDGNLNFSKKIMEMLYGTGPKKEEYGHIIFADKNSGDTSNKDLNQLDGQSVYYEDAKDIFKKKKLNSTTKNRKKKKNENNSESEGKEGKDKKVRRFKDFKNEFDEWKEEKKEKETCNIKYESNDKDYTKILINQINKIKEMSVEEYMKYLEHVFNSGEHREKAAMTEQDRVNIFLDFMRKDIEIDKGVQRKLEEKCQTINYIESIGNKLETSIDKEKII